MEDFNLVTISHLQMAGEESAILKIPQEEYEAIVAKYGTKRQFLKYDTIYLPSIVEQIKGVDLLFHEATFANEDAPRAKETFHTTAAQAAEIARKAEVKKLLIGHFFGTIRR